MRPRLITTAIIFLALCAILLTFVLPVFASSGITVWINPSGIGSPIVNPNTALALY